MQKTYAHPNVFTAGTGVRRLKFVVGTNREEVIVDLDKRSVTSKCELFGATTTVALGKSPAELEITVHTAFNAELKFSVNFETGAVAPLGDSVISSPVPSMASFISQKYFAGVDKTLLVTQGPPPPVTSDLLYPTSLSNSGYGGLYDPFKPQNPKIILDPSRDKQDVQRQEVPHERYPDRAIQLHEEGLRRSSIQHQGPLFGPDKVTQDITREDRLRELYPDRATREGKRDSFEH